MSVETEDSVTGVDLGPHRRRRSWSVAEKRRIVAESLEPGASVSVVARRHDVNANLVFTWRRQMRDGLLDGGEAARTFVPVVVGAADEPRGELNGVGPAAQPAAGRMEIELAGGRRVIIDREVNAAALARVIAVLERR